MAELVVLADDNGRPIGTADKATVHTSDTPLHLAFSAYLVDDHGRTLLTRRALTKKTWPGVWTNSFCGHPGPGEANEHAVYRRALDELGIPESAITDVTEVLPDFSYRAVDSSGIVEHEICPVFLVRLADIEAVSLNPAEVDSHRWVDADDLIAASELVPDVFSPWLVWELAEQPLRDAFKR